MQRKSLLERSANTDGIKKCKQTDNSINFHFRKSDNVDLNNIHIYTKQMEIKRSIFNLIYPEKGVVG